MSNVKDKYCSTEILPSQLNTKFVYILIFSHILITRLISHSEIVCTVMQVQPVSILILSMQSLGKNLCKQIDKITLQSGQSCGTFFLHVSDS